MTAVSSEVDAKARKYRALVLQSIARVGQEPIGTAVGVSGSTVSRFTGDEEEKGMLRALQILAASGLKVVPTDRICVDRSMYHALVTIAAGAMNNPETVQKLVWED